MKAFLITPGVRGGGFIQQHDVANRQQASNLIRRDETSEVVLDDMRIDFLDRLWFNLLAPETSPYFTIDNVIIYGNGLVWSQDRDVKSTISDLQRAITWSNE